MERSQATLEMDNPEEERDRLSQVMDIPPKLAPWAPCEQMDHEQHNSDEEP